MPYDVSEHVSLKIFFFLDALLTVRTYLFVTHADAALWRLRPCYEMNMNHHLSIGVNARKMWDVAPHRIANARARDISFRCVSAWSTSDLYLSDFSWGACLSGLLRIVWYVFRVRCLRESRFSRIATQLCHYCRSRNRKRTLRYVWNSYQHNSDVTGKIMISDRNRETLCIFFLHIYYVNTRLLFAANSAW